MKRSTAAALLAIVGALAIGGTTNAEAQTCRGANVCPEPEPGSCLARACIKSPTGPFGTCGFVPSDSLCDDGVACNGAETCDPLTNECQAGSAIDCDDADSCTIDACNEPDGDCSSTLVPLDPMSIDAITCNVEALVESLAP